MAKTDEPKTRPSWQTDAKWVVGIVAFLVVAATALVGSLVKLTERETAMTLASTVMATMFSPSGLDDPRDVDLVRAELETDPDQTLEPLPGVTITAADVEGKSPREIRLLLFRRLAEPIYDHGTFADSTNEPAANVDEQGLITPTADQVGLLVLLSNESHQLILKVQTIALIVSALLLLLLIALSTGFGRLVSPGWVLLLVSGLPMIILTLASLYLERSSPAPPTGEPSIATVAASAAADLAPTVLAAVRSIYAPLLWTGLGLILVATLGGLAYHLWQRRTVA